MTFFQLLLCSVVVKRTSLSLLVLCCVFVVVVISYFNAKRIERAFQCFYLFSICLILDLLAFVASAIFNLYNVLYTHINSPPSNENESEKDSKNQSYGVASAPSSPTNKKNCCSWLNNFHFSAFWIASSLYYITFVDMAGHCLLLFSNVS